MQFSRGRSRLAEYVLIANLIMAAVSSSSSLSPRQRPSKASADGLHVPRATAIPAYKESSVHRISVQCMYLYQFDSHCVV